jgi:hypothetical protein
VTGQPGGQVINPPPPAGTSPVPTPVAPLPPATTAPGTPPAGAPGATPPGEPGTPPATAAPTPAAPTPAEPAPAAPGAAPGATAAQVIVTVPGTTFQVGGGPYTVPVSINNAQRVSVVTLTITFNPKVLSVRNVQDGTFMRQGGVPTNFTPRIDNAAGRVDIAVTRTADKTGASGAGLLGALLFDAVGPGSSIIQTAGVASTPDGGPVALQFSPVTVTVR